MKAHNDPVRVGDEYTSFYGLPYKVVKIINDKECLVRFKESGNVQKYSYRAIGRNAHIKDYATEKFCGVGYAIGTISQPINKDTPAFKQWRGILGRCYSPGRPRCYNIASVCAEWHCFNNFERWYNEEKELLMDSLFIHPFDVCVDKDLFGNNRKIYSSETCCILPRAINSCLHGLEIQIDKVVGGISKTRRETLIALLDEYGSMLKERTVNRLKWVLSQTREKPSTQRPKSRLRAVVSYNGVKYNAKTINELKSIIKIIDTEQ